MSDQLSPHYGSAARPMPKTGLARLIRGWVIAALAVVLAAIGHQTAHVLGGHGEPAALPIPILLLTVALAAPGSVLLAGRRVAKWSTAAATILAQLIFHGIYSMATPLAATGGMYANRSSSLSSHGHHHHGFETAAALSAVSSTSVSSSAVDGTHAHGAFGFYMLAAHLMAAALTTWLIVHGESTALNLGYLLLLRPVHGLFLALDRSQPVLSQQRVVFSDLFRPRKIELTLHRLTRGPPQPPAATLSLPFI